MGKLSTERLSHLLQVTQYQVELGFGPGSPGSRAPSLVTWREAIQGPGGQRALSTGGRAGLWMGPQLALMGQKAGAGGGVGRRLTITGAALC